MQHNNETGMNLFESFVMTLPGSREAAAQHRAPAWGLWTTALDKQSQ